MGSWRDTVSSAAQADIDGLLEPAWEFAGKLLKKYREFYPFAFAVARDGEERMIAADLGTEFPDSSALHEFLFTGLVQQKSELRAAAVAADVRLPEEGSDAIQLTMEHAEGIALQILIPYRVRRFPPMVVFEEMSVSEVDPRIWVN